MTRARTRWVPERGDVLQKGLTPFVAVSGRSFNQAAGSLVCWRVSMDPRHQDNPFAVQIGTKRSGFGYVLCHQPQSVDWRTQDVSRHAWRRLDDVTLEAALFKLNEVLSGD